MNRLLQYLTTLAKYTPTVVLSLDDAKFLFSAALVYSALETRKFAFSSSSFIDLARKWKIEVKQTRYVHERMKTLFDSYVVLARKRLFSPTLAAIE
jgi:hypothetical protein